MSLFLELFAVVECLLFVCVGVFAVAGPVPGIPTDAGGPLVLLACIAGVLPVALAAGAVVGFFKRLMS